MYSSKIYNKYVETMNKFQVMLDDPYFLVKKPRVVLLLYCVMLENDKFI